MEEVPQSPIRPALETLRELDEARFMDKLAVAIHDAVSDVQHLGKKSTVVITLEFAPLSKAGMTEPVITAEADISAKRPKPDGHKALFFVDADGNPTTQQQRQRDLGFTVAGNAQQGAGQ